MCSTVLRTPSYLTTTPRSLKQTYRVETDDTLHEDRPRKRLGNLLHSKKALAIPVTYLMLFVSLIVVISATYSFAAVKINARGNIIRAAVARQNMQFLDDAVHSVAWSFGASEAVYMDDTGAVFRTEITTKPLLINFTDEQTISDVVFNSSVGRAFYELPSGSDFESSFVRGDERSIVNQSSFTMTQLYTLTEKDTRILVLCYRPSATVAVIGASDGKPLNLIRINIINLNSSESLALREKFYLKITSLNVTTITHRYEFNSSVSSLELKAVLDGTSDTVWLPISSNVDGAVVDVEVVTCSIQIREVEV